MKTIKGAILTLAVIALSSVESIAIEGLKLSVQCSNVVLSWPSLEGETYIVQYRPTLDPSTPWQTLTSSLPADVGTNLTFYVHSNIVLNPVCNGGSFSMMISGGESLSSTLGESSSESDTPMVMQPGGTSDAVPLFLYPPGLDLSNFLIFDPLTGESVSGSGYEVSSVSFNSPQANDLDPSDAEPQDAGSGSGSPDTGFYQVTRIGIHVLGLTNLTSGFVSNTIVIPFEAANDVGTLQGVTALVDGTRYRGVEPLFSPGINGKLVMDTTFLENGDHTVQLQGGWLNPDVDGDNFQQFSDGFTLSVSNFVYFPEWEDEVGELGFSAYFAKTVCTNADWQIQIYDVNSNYVQTLSGHTDDGIIETNWNLMDWQGNFRTNADIDSEFSGIIIIGDPATNKVPPKVASSYPDHGQWVITFQDTFQETQNSNHLYSSIYGMGSIGANYGGAYTIFPTYPTNGQTFPLRWPSDHNSVSATTMIRDDHALESLMTNKLNRNFYYNGHVHPDAIAFSMDSKWISYILKKQYYRFVFIDGCSSANGSLPAAFGINFNSTQNMSYFQKHGIRPRAFVGYSKDVFYRYHGDYTDPVTGAKQIGQIPPSVYEFLDNFEFYWYFNYDLSSSIYYGVLDTPFLGIGWQTGEDLKIYGFDGLRVDDYNYGSQWSN